LGGNGTKKADNNEGASREELDKKAAADREAPLASIS